MEILTVPKNALVRQYQRMFELDGVELDFEEPALEAIADLAVLRQTGARGLRAIMEEVLGPIMFEVPSSTGVARVVVTKAAVLDNAAPTIVPHKPRRAEKSAWRIHLLVRGPLQAALDSVVDAHELPVRPVVLDVEHVRLAVVGARLEAPPRDRQRHAAGGDVVIGEGLHQSQGRRGRWACR